MKDWLAPLLRCLKCGANQLEVHPDRVDCLSCGKSYETRNGITSFFAETIHPVLQKELAAIRKLDESTSREDLKELHSLLQTLDSADAKPTPVDQAKFGCIQHLMDSKRQIQDLLSTHPIPSGSTIVEIGADHCWISNLFLDRNCRVIGLDISDHLELATRADDPRLRRMKADMNMLPLQDRSCDIVWSTSAAHHSWDLKRTFQEAHRILKSGGSLFFCCEPLPSSLRYPFGQDFGAHERSLGINECWIPRSNWIRFCKEAGFHNIELIFPDLGGQEIRQRLKSRHLPSALAGILRPFLKSLQVSIHLKAMKEL